MRDLVRGMVSGRGRQAPTRTWASAAALVCGRVPTQTCVRGFILGFRGHSRHRRTAAGEASSGSSPGAAGGAETSREVAG
jgi:hypothetical protein